MAAAEEHARQRTAASTGADGGPDGAGPSGSRDPSRALKADREAQADTP